MTKEERKEYMRLWYQRNKEATREYRLKRKEGAKKYQRLYRQKHKDRIKESWRLYYQTHRKQLIAKACKWNLANPLKIAKIMRRIHYRNRYGMTVEDYERLFEKQNGCCAICRIHRDKLNRALDVDHDHKTGEIRGLLCKKCNVALGTTKAENLNERQKIYLRGFKMTIERDYEVEIIETTVTKGVLKVRAENEAIARVIACETWEDGDIGSHENYTPTIECDGDSVDFVAIQ